MDNTQQDYLNLLDLIIINTWLTAVVVGYYHLQQMQSSSRRWWVRPINKNARAQRGHYRHLFLRMKTIDPEQFFVYCRMTPRQFSKLLLIVRPFLKKKNHRAIKPAERLAITLRYLAHGGSMQTVAWDYGIGKSTAAKVIKETCEAIWDALAFTHMSTPNICKWKSIANGFYEKWNLPNCVGAIDGKLISIQCPKKGGTLYYSYKKIHAIILLAVCDSNYNFTMVNIGGYGSQGDRTIFRESTFGQQIIEGTINVPEPTELPRSKDILPHFFVGDEAFPLCKHLMRPYPGRFLDEEKKIFNYRLSRARRTIENAFGILVSRWRIFRGPIIANPETVDSIVKAAVCLHNFLKKDEENIINNERRYCTQNYVDQENSEGEVTPGQWRESAISHLQNISQVGSNNPAQQAIEIRNGLKAYLVSPEGAVAWQYSHIRRGIIQ